MILFDAGKTLIDYIPKDQVRGRESLMAYLSTINATEILMQYIVHNPGGYDAATIDRVTNEIFAKYE
ncbi:MAG: hypothetical protein J6I64_08830, partial [Lachnospiraceae bacterium]|nr:hypothetical protein [Lachnospiraceae bacterium]